MPDHEGRPGNPAPLSRAPVAPALLSGNPLRWLTVFGPGAVVASLTIGTGELIFSTRGGALFGYKILSLFIAISIMKWALVFASARHFVLSGVHPYRRMMDLPGPRGWLTILLFIMGVACFPIWVSFHSGVLGNLTAWVTDTRHAFGGGGDYLWGALFLAGVLVLTFTGGYSTLERVQLAIVTTLLVCAGITVVLYEPEWLQVLKGAMYIGELEYPPWLTEEGFPEIAKHSEWIEATRYVGVIGGAGYDYLAYVSFLRDKRWGNATAPAGDEELESIAADRGHPIRLWLRAPLVDCTLSFIVVVVFSAVFVVSGALVLAPAERIPDQENLLNLQAQFVTDLHPWLLPVYVVGAFLTMIGTLYGTLEVAITVVRETVLSFCDLSRPAVRRLRAAVILWCASAAAGILIWLFLHQRSGGEDRPRALLAILTPANLFTGVLLCGLLCSVNLWMDQRFLPRALRAPWIVQLINAGAGGVFLFLGVKGYMDAGWAGLFASLGLIAVSMGLAVALRKLRR